MPPSLGIAGNSGPLGCSSDVLTDGNHDLYGMVAGNSSTQAMFDFLTYTPSQNITSGDFEYTVDANNSSSTYAYTAGLVMSSGKLVPGAIFNFNFTGWLTIFSLM